MDCTLYNDLILAAYRTEKEKTWEIIYWCLDLCTTFEWLVHEKRLTTTPLNVPLCILNTGRMLYT